MHVLPTSTAARLARLARLAALTLGLALAPDARGAAAAKPEAPVDLQVFRAALAPLGEWVGVPGAPVAWRPEGVPADWQPYRDGQWRWTSTGWFWVSKEPWAWATYHYGRWRLDPAKGWVWLPGGAWAPARVVWRRGGGAVGWAPETDDGFLLPGHWTFLPELRVEGVAVPSGAIPSPRVPHLLAASRPKARGGPKLAAAEPPHEAPLALSSSKGERPFVLRQAQHERTPN